MFRQDLKNNLKDEIMCDEKTLSNMFDLIKIVINFNDKLYKKVIKKRYDQSWKRAKIFFESTIEY